MESQAGRLNSIITDGDHRYWWNVCGLTSGSSFIEENDKAIGSTSSFICTASPTIFIAMTSLLSSEDCTLVSLHEPSSTLSATVQLCKTNVYLSVLCAILPTPPPQKKPCRQISFYVMHMFLKNSPTSNTKFSFKTVYFLTLWDWKFHPIVYVCMYVCMYVSLLDIWACSVYIPCIYSIYTFIHF